MKISELKERRVVRRATQNFDELGHRIYNTYEHDFPYNPLLDKNFSLRYHAKLIDTLPAGIVLYYLFQQNFLISSIVAVVFSILLNSITEWKTGQSLGKKILNLIVIDDFGKFPHFLQSLQRNILCLINLFPAFYDSQDRSGIWFTSTKLNFKYFNMNYNCYLTETLVVKVKIHNEIKDLLFKNEGVYKSKLPVTKKPL